MKSQRTRKKGTTLNGKGSEPLVEIVPQIGEAADGALEGYTTSGKRPRRKATRDLTQILLVIFQFLLDGAMITLGFVMAYFVRSKVPLGGPLITYSPQNYSLILAVSVASVLVAFYFRHLYGLKRGYSRIDEFYRICAAVLIGLILALALNSLALGPDFQYSRQVLLYALVLIIVFVSLARFIQAALIGFARRRGMAQVRLLLAGTGETTARILRRVTESPELGYRIVGVLEDDLTDSREPRLTEHMPVVGKISQLREKILALEVDEVIVAIGRASQNFLLELVDRCEDLPVSVKIYPDAFQLITSSEGAIADLTGLPLVSVKDSSLRGINRAVKRVVDVVISGLVLILSSPLLLLQALLIKITDPSGPVLYFQERVGLDGRPFTVIKFRSMKATSEETGPGWTVKNDPRRTRLGTFMRRYSLDELPQFINVLMGDMSIVGPRPEQIHKVEEFSQKYPRYSRRHKEKAGITGWAQVNGLRGDTSIEERIRYDLYYVENWSVLFDLKIMLKTLIVIFSDKNAY